jgi:hypothetical protein
LTFHAADESVQAQMVAYRAKDKIARLRVVDQGSEEQLLFFMEVTHVGGHEKLPAGGHGNPG